jgi:hypothetical protein
VLRPTPPQGKRRTSADREDAYAVLDLQAKRLRVHILAGTKELPLKVEGNDYRLRWREDALLKAARQMGQAAVGRWGYGGSGGAFP